MSAPWDTPAFLAERDQRAAQERDMRPEALKVSRHYERGLITLAEFIAELAEIHAEHE